MHLFADYTESHSGAIGEKINLKLRPETDTMFPKLLESSPDWDVGKGNPIGYKAISFSSKQSEASVRINSYFSGVVRIICTYDIYNPQKGSSYFARKHAIFEISCSSPNPNPDIAPDDPSPNVQPGDVGSYFQEDTQEGTSLLFRVVYSGVAKEICAYVVKPAGNAGANVQHQKATLTVPSRVRGLNVRGIDSYGLGALEKVETIILPNTIVDYCSRGITVLNNNKLSTIVLQSETPPNAYGNDSFQSELYSKVKLLVPSQRAVENYKSALVWKKFENIGVVDEPDPIEVISILFPNYIETLNVGSRMTLDPIITPYNAETKLKWESSNTKVATVSQSGDVEGLKEGESKITVTSSNGKSAYCYVKVNATPKPQLSLSASPTSGEVEKGNIVKLTAKANGSIVSADIYYTLNGENPTKSSTKYTSSGITINSDCTIKAIAYKDGYETSAVMTASYKVTPTPKPQLFLSASPTSGEVEKGTVVKLTAKANGSIVSADIYYALNGDNPTKSSTKYTSSGITINSDCTIKAIAYKDGYETSAIMTASYKVIESAERYSKLKDAIEDLVYAIVGSDNMTLRAEAEALYNKIYDGIKYRTIVVDEIESLLVEISKMMNRLGIPTGMDTASDINPIECTSVIFNPNYIEGNDKGWTGLATVNSIVLNAEKYNTNYNYFQLLQGLPKGTYQVTLTGFYRAGSAANDYATFVKTPNKNNNAMLYAVGEAGTICAVPMMRLASQAQVYESLPDGYVWASKENSLGVPNTMLTAGDIFMCENKATGKNFYAGNCVTVNVGEDGKLTIGLMKTDFLPGDWTTWTNWQLFYFGKNSTLIPDICVDAIKEISIEIVKTEYFNINGEALSKTQKGFIIMKQTMSDGSAKVKKVVIK